jgi:hypothetical protein
VYYYTKDWSPLPLDGDWTAPGQIRLAEGDPGDTAAKPRFDLKVSQTRAVEGTWTSADGRRVLPVTLTRVPKPPSFEVAIHRAQQFVHPKWPIRLTYPVGWRLDFSDDDLTLRSSDARDMLFENELHCVRGTGLPPAPLPGEPPVEFARPFFRGESGWLVETGLSGDCMTETCEPPQSRGGGAGAFMKASMSYRSQGPWGYMGLADAPVYLVVVGQAWARCSDRLLDRDTRITVAPTHSRTR